MDRLILIFLHPISQNAPAANNYGKEIVSIFRHYPTSEDTDLPLQLQSPESAIKVAHDRLELATQEPVPPLLGCSPQSNAALRGAQAAPADGLPAK
jgi:hypothetical protein